LKPPESDTMQALKSGFDCAGADEDSAADGESEAAGSAVFVVPRSPQPAKVRAATAHRATTRAVFFTAPPDLDFRSIGSRPGEK
jgi:hypothetical protein